METLTMGKTENRNALENALEYIFSNFDEKNYNEIAYISGNLSIVEEICHESHNIVSAVLNERVESILEIGAGYGTFTGSLADLSEKLYCVEADEKKTRINRIRQKGRTNINFLNELETDRNFDFIFINGADERIENYGFTSIVDMYQKLKSHISPNGKILLILANIYGEYSAEDKYDYNQVRESLLGVGADSINTMYPYPGIRKNMLFNFSDLRKPYVSELFFDVNICKTGSYEELMENNSYADCFVVMISGKEERTVEYSKISIMRREPFRIRTDMVTDKMGVQSIVKRTVGSDNRHILNMAKSYECLKNIFGNSIIGVNRLIKADKNSVEFEFLQGDVLFDVIRETMKKDAETACEYIYRYAQILRSKAYNKFKYTDEFREIFGSYLDTEEFYSLDYTDIDLCFDNFIINEDKWIIIDYEFCFDFPIPIDYVIYRSILYFFSKIGTESDAKYKAVILRKLGLSKHAPAFHKMETEFQKYVVGDTTYQRHSFSKANTENRDFTAAIKEIKNAQK